MSVLGAVDWTKYVALVRLATAPGQNLEEVFPPDMVTTILGDNGLINLVVGPPGSATPPTDLTAIWLNQSVASTTSPGACQIYNGATWVPASPQIVAAVNTTMGISSMTAAQVATVSAVLSPSVATAISSSVPETRQIAASIGADPSSSLYVANGIAGTPSAVNAISGSMAGKFATISNAAAANINMAGVTSGQTLQWNGTEFVAVTPSGGSALPANAAGVLTNNGSGTLSWVVGGAGLSISSAAQALAGTDNTTAMSPLDTRNAINAINALPSGVTAGTYGDATHVPIVTVDATGRVTSASVATITGGGSSTLAADTDVTISAPANNNVLTYSTGAGKWLNAPSSNPGAVAPTGLVVTASGTIPDSAATTLTSYVASLNETTASVVAASGVGIPAAEAGWWLISLALNTYIADSNTQLRLLINGLTVAEQLLTGPGSLGELAAVCIPIKLNTSDVITASVYQSTGAALAVSVALRMVKLAFGAPGVVPVGLPVTTDTSLSGNGNSGTPLTLNAKVSAPLTGIGTAGSPIAMPAATTGAPGYMSAADKTKLDGLSGGGGSGSSAVGSTLNSATASFTAGPGSNVPASLGGVSAGDPGSYIILDSGGSPSNAVVITKPTAAFSTYCALATGYTVSGSAPVVYNCAISTPLSNYSVYASLTAGGGPAVGVVSNITTTSFTVTFNGSWNGAGGATILRIVVQA